MRTPSPLFWQIRQPIPLPAMAATDSRAHPLATGTSGPQLGNGHYANGHDIHVDYSPVLPQIVDMLRFYVKRQDTQDIAERLNELEYLMRSGTPTAASRSRLNQLVASSPRSSEPIQASCRSSSRLRD